MDKGFIEDYYYMTMFNERKYELDEINTFVLKLSLSLRAPFCISILIGTFLIVLLDIHNREN
jgi:hypothetical protein